MPKVDTSFRHSRAKSQRFPRARRLLSRAQFTAALKSSALFRDRSFVAYALRESEDHARLGVVVSRKVSTRAVDRNRLKRQIRESFRRHGLMAAVHVVVIAQAAARHQSNDELRQTLMRLWDVVEKKCKQR